MQKNLNDEQILRLLNASVGPVIISFNKDYISDVPDWIITRVKAKRIANPNQVTDEEVLVYLLTASLSIPLSDEFANIYLHVVGKVMEDAGIEVPESLKVPELTEYEKEELENLRRFIKKKREKREKELIIKFKRSIKGEK